MSSIFDAFFWIEPVVSRSSPKTVSAIVCVRDGWKIEVPHPHTPNLHSPHSLYSINPPHTSYPPPHLLSALPITLSHTQANSTKVLWTFPPDVSKITQQYQNIPEHCFPGSPLSSRQVRAPVPLFAGPRHRLP